MTDSFDDFMPNSNNKLSKEETELFNEVFETDYSKCNIKPKHKPLYDCSYNTILFAIIITIIFLIFACPLASMWFGYYVPDPYFNLFTRALIFFILVFFFYLIFTYHLRSDDD